MSEELGRHWLTVEVDVTEARAVAARFGVAAIPTAVAAEASGTVLGRVLGFVEPERFRRELEALRGKR